MPILYLICNYEIAMKSLAIISNLSMMLSGYAQEIRHLISCVLSVSLFQSTYKYMAEADFWNLIIGF